MPLLKQVRSGSLIKHPKTNRLIVIVAKGRPVKKDPEVAVVTQDMLRSIRDETAKKPGRQAAVIDRTDIEKMKERTKIETAEMIKEQAKLAT